MAKLKPYFLDTKFRGLKALSIVLFVVSGLSVLAAFFYLIALFKAEETYQRMALLVPLSASFLSSLFWATAGGAINVLIDIEMNSRETNQLLEQIIGNLPDDTAGHN